MGREFYAYGSETLLVDGEAQARLQLYTIWWVSGSERRIVDVSEIVPSKLAGVFKP